MFARLARMGMVRTEGNVTVLRRAGWADSSAVVLCDVLDNASHDPTSVSPRQVLRRQISD